MLEFLMILAVVGIFLAVFFLVSVVRERELLRKEREEKPHYRKAA